MKYIEGTEQPSRYWDKKKLVFAGGAFAIASYIGAVAYIGETDPVNQYDQNFTDTGKCLNGTPYDKDNGATRDLVSVDGGEIVRVIPKDANNHDPSVLYITKTDRGWYGFGDHQTGTLLVEQNCENIPNGY